MTDLDPWPRAAGTSRCSDSAEYGTRDDAIAFCAPEGWATDIHIADRDDGAIGDGGPEGRTHGDLYLRNHHSWML
jgi:hypothetical protein